MTTTKTISVHDAIKFISLLDEDLTNSQIKDRLSLLRLPECLVQGAFGTGMKKGKKSQGRRIKPDLSLTKVRAALSNGRALLLRDAADGRLAWARRLRDLVAESVFLSNTELADAHVSLL